MELSIYYHEYTRKIFRTFLTFEIRDSASRLANSGMAAAGNLMQSGWNAFNQMKESYS